MKDLHSRFGFHSTPFTREIAVDKRFTLPVFDEALDALQRVVQQRMSAAVIAPAGTGKTVLLRSLEKQLPDARYRVTYIKVTGLAKRDMCREIAFAVGCTPAGCYPMLVRRLQEHFLSNTDTDGLRPVLLVDEAHDLRPEVLGMLRLLTNFEMDSRLVISIILSGQSPLKNLLRRDDIEDVARRMSHYATLRPLTREESLRYVEHRCTTAGASAIPFDSTSIDAMFEIARGNLRATDRLGLMSLEVAHLAGCDVVDSNHLVEARRLLWP